MVIDINQKKIAFGDKYKIYINGNQKYMASTELVAFQPEIYLFDLLISRARLIIQKEWTWFSTEYKITFWDNNSVKFSSHLFWKSHDKCRIGNDNYDIYGHKGLKYSVFKNDIQVAWWDKKMVTWFEGDNYKIIADDDCVYELIIGFCLIIDNSSGSNSDNTVTIDLGNIGPEVKKFDFNWKPKPVI